jgi:hypothetical protein
MPTPFYHLSVAQDILANEYLRDSIRIFLRKYLGAFFLGNVAPDVQVVSGQSRQSTHFFELPIKNNLSEPWENMMANNQELSHANKLNPAQAAFVAGYLCHLKADWLWVQNIFVPVFGLHSDWGTFPQRLYLHNVLRAYLDLRILPGLHHDIENHLRRALPDHWLPFVSETDLCKWRDFLAGQLQPRGKISTVEVFAQRQGISPKEYYRMITSEETMEREVFSHLSRQSLDEYHIYLLVESRKILEEYLGNVFYDSSWE